MKKIAASIVLTMALLGTLIHCTLDTSSGKPTPTNPQSPPSYPQPAEPVQNPAPIPVPSPAPSPVPPAQPTPAPSYPEVGWVLAYDKLVMSLVSNDMLNLPASRMSTFCPAWGGMSADQKKQFFADLAFSIAAPESDYQNLSMYIEDTLGIDPLTGLPVVSEGLLQLSYQDIQGTPRCDFNAKKDLPALKDDVRGRATGSFLSHHPERDTLNPIKNLSCGVWIMDGLYQKHPGEEFARTMSRYWSTMRRGHPEFEQIKQQMKLKESPCEVK